MYRHIWSYIEFDRNSISKLQFPAPVQQICFLNVLIEPELTCCADRHFQFTVNVFLIQVNQIGKIFLVEYYKQSTNTI